MLPFVPRFWWMECVLYVIESPKGCAKTQWAGGCPHGQHRGATRQGSRRLMVIWAAAGRCV